MERQRRSISISTFYPQRCCELELKGGLFMIFIFAKGGLCTFFLMEGGDFRGAERVLNLESFLCLSDCWKVSCRPWCWGSLMSLLIWTFDWTTQRSHSARDFSLTAWQKRSAFHFNTGDYAPYLHQMRCVSAPFLQWSRWFWSLCVFTLAASAACLWSLTALVIQSHS